MHTLSGSEMLRCLRGLTAQAQLAMAHIVKGRIGVTRRQALQRRLPAMAIQAPSQLHLAEDNSYMGLLGGSLPAALQRILSTQMNFVNEKNRPLLIVVAVLAIGGAVFSCAHFMMGSAPIVVPAQVPTSSASPPPPPAAVTFGSQYKNSLPRPSGASTPPPPGQ